METNFFFTSPDHFPKSTGPPDTSCLFMEAARLLCNHAHNMLIHRAVDGHIPITEYLCFFECLNIQTLVSIKIYLYILVVADATEYHMLVSTLSGR